MEDKKKSREKLWIRLEENEERFFSLWCEVVDLRSATLFYNTHFNDDPIFNHVTGIRAKKADVGRIIEEALVLFSKVNVSPFFYTSPMTKPYNLKKYLTNRGFRFSDTMAVMRMVDPTTCRNAKVSSRNRLVTREATLSNLGSWIGVFARAFNLPQSWLKEVRGKAEVIVRDKNSRFLLAFYEGEPCGCMCIYSSQGAVGVYCLGTEPKFRGRGIATELLNEALEMTKPSEDLCLQCLSSDGVEEFYLKRGLTTEFVRKIYAVQ